MTMFTSMYRESLNLVNVADSFPEYDFKLVIPDPIDPDNKAIYLLISNRFLESFVEGNCVIAGYSVTKNWGYESYSYSDCEYRYINITKPEIPRIREEIKIARKLQSEARCKVLTLTPKLKLVELYDFSIKSPKDIDLVRITKENDNSILIVKAPENCKPHTWLLLREVALMNFNNVDTNIFGLKVCEYWGTKWDEMVNYRFAPIPPAYTFTDLIDELKGSYIALKKYKGFQATVHIL